MRLRLSIFLLIFHTLADFGKIFSHKSHTGLDLNRSLFWFTYAEQPPSRSLPTAARLPFEIDLHYAVWNRCHLVPMLADIHFGTAMAAFSGFTPCTQNCLNTDRSTPPHELTRQARFPNCHAHGVSCFCQWFNGLADESFMHGRYSTGKLTHWIVLNGTSSFLFLKPELNILPWFQWVEGTVFDFFCYANPPEFATINTGKNRHWMLAVR